MCLDRSVSDFACDPGIMRSLFCVLSRWRHPNDGVDPRSLLRRPAGLVRLLRSATSVGTATPRAASAADCRVSGMVGCSSDGLIRPAIHSLESPAVEGWCIGSRPFLGCAHSYAQYAGKTIKACTPSPSTAAARPGAPAGPRGESLAAACAGLLQEGQSLRAFLVDPAPARLRDGLPAR
jgi:hypothetical protein